VRDVDNAEKLSLARSEESVQGQKRVVERLQQLEGERDALRLELWRLKRKPSGVIGYGLLVSGVTALVLSISFSSSILAFIGLGLTFWGVLLLYIRPVRYVKATLLDSSAVSSLVAISRVITDLNYAGKGIYLPPRYLKEFKSSSIFVPSESTLVIPPVEDVSHGKVFLEDPKGLLLTPSGLDLANLYEKELGMDFVKTDLNYLRNNLPKVFIESLEIAEDLEINSGNEVVCVRIIGSVYQELCREARKLPRICNSFGCPLCSSIAVALTRAIGKPIIIERTEINSDGKTIETCFRTL